MNDLFVGSKSAETDKGFKIISLEAENVKRLSAVEIRPDGNLVEITGKNGQGKTSILDAIWWAMKGRGVVQSTPIRKGQEEAHITLNLGSITVRRRFKAAKEGPGFTTDIRVEAADGFRAQSPQALLDGLMGDLSIDPLAFMRMDAKQQFDMLRGFVDGFDFDAHDDAQKEDFAKRTDINRDAKRARATADQIIVPEGLPAEQADEAALTAELARAGEHNGSLEARRLRRETAAQTIAELLRLAKAAEDELPAQIDEIERQRDGTIADLRAQIAALEARITSAQEVAVHRADEARRLAAEEAQQNRATAAATQQRLDVAGPLPDPIDVADLQARIGNARTINAGIRQRELRDRQIENAIELEAQSKLLTETMQARERAKAKAIAAASLPVPGIEFGDGELLLNGLPLDQASDAEQLRTSVAIAMAMHPKLRVVRVRDGNILDADGMKLLAELAAANDCQVWVETVRSDDRLAFVIEDGRVRSAKAVGEAA